MNTTPQRERFFRRLLQGSGPLWVWALHFFCAYALVATACCTEFAATQWFGISAVRLSLWGLSVLAAMVIAWLIAYSLRMPHGLLRSAGALGGALALIGMAWTTLPMMWALPLCTCQP